MLVRATGLVAIPDELSAVEAAPLLCAGIATFNALKKSAVQAGSLVAVQGVGGLGHMAIQYAQRMGMRVVAIGRGREPERDALALGAHHYLDSRQEDPVAFLQIKGGAQVVPSTITDSDAVSMLASGLAPQGRLLVVGVGMEPLSLQPRLLVGGERLVQGTITGSPFDIEQTLDFSLLTRVRAMVETLPLA